MFELIPFDRHSRGMSAFDPFGMFDEMDRRFMTGAPAVTAFRTDVIDTGDAFKLESELPGFNKEDIKIDIEQQGREGQLHQARALLRLLLPQL